MITGKSVLTALWFIVFCRLVVSVFSCRPASFIYLFMAALGLHCCPRAFSSCGGGAALQLRCAGFLRWWLFLLWSTSSRALGPQWVQSVGSGVVAHGFSWPAACGGFLEQGWIHVSCVGGFLTPGPPGKSWWLSVVVCLDSFISQIFFVNLPWIHFCFMITVRVTHNLLTVTVSVILKLHFYSIPHVFCCCCYILHHCILYIP